MAEKESCEVVCFEHPPGITMLCSKCRRVLRSGRWCVGLIVSGTYRYVVGVNPPPMCCGEEKQIIECFETEAEVQGLAAKVIAQLNRDGTTENLKLYEAYAAVSEAVH